MIGPLDSSPGLRTIRRGGRGGAEYRIGPDDSTDILDRPAPAEPGPLCALRPGSTPAGRPPAEGGGSRGDRPLLRNGVTSHGTAQRSCCSASDAADAARVADRLSIPFYAVGLREGVLRHRRPVRASIGAAARPSPCHPCTSASVRASFRVRARRGRRDGRDRALRRIEARASVPGGDPARRTRPTTVSGSRERLASVRFPIGLLNEGEVRERARAGACRSRTSPSRWRSASCRRALPRRPSRRARARAGWRQSWMQRRTIGSHQGIEGFTVRQRAACPRVRRRATWCRSIRKPVRRDGTRADLLAAVCPPVGRPVAVRGRGRRDRGIRLRGEIRAQHAGADRGRTSDRAARRRSASFSRESAITPGQAAVFYRGDDVRRRRLDRLGDRLRLESALHAACTETPRAVVDRLPLAEPVPRRGRSRLLDEAPLEPDGFRGRDLDLLARLRVAPDARLPVSSRGRFQTRRSGPSGPS